MREVLIAVWFCIAIAGCANTRQCGLIGGMVETRVADDSNIRTCSTLLSGKADDFAETPLGTDTYRIEGYGNSRTSPKKTNAVVLVRAAELARMHGYQRFAILNYDTWAKTDYYSAPARAVTTTDLSARAYSYGYGTNLYGTANSQTRIYGGGMTAVESPRVDIVVRFISNGSPDSASALSVSEILARYGKIAGYKPENAVQLTNGEPVAQPEQTRPQKIAEQAPISGYDAPYKPTLAAVQSAPDRAVPTLDEVYKSLSAAEQARVNRLPPAQRADYLAEIRERRF